MVTKKRSGSAIDVVIGQKVRGRRMEQCMSQTELGAELGITFQQIQKYEKGVNRIGSGRLAEIARVLGVPPSYFFDGFEAEAAQTGNSNVAKTLTSKYGVEIIRHFPAIPDELKPVLRDLAVALGSMKLAKKRA